eukprot:g5236.t1
MKKSEAIFTFTSNPSPVVSATSLFEFDAKSHSTISDPFSFAAPKAKIKYPEKEKVKISKKKSVGKSKVFQFESLDIPKIDLTHKVSFDTPPLPPVTTPPVSSLTNAPFRFRSRLAQVAPALFERILTFPGADSDGDLFLRAIVEYLHGRDKDIFFSVPGSCKKSFLEKAYPSGSNKCADLGLLFVFQVNTSTAQVVENIFSTNGRKTRFIHSLQLELMKLVCFFNKSSDQQLAMLRIIDRAFENEENLYIGTVSARRRIIEIMTWSKEKARDELKSAMLSVDLVIRGDSRLCKAFIEGRTEKYLDEVVAIMRITSHLFSFGHKAWSNSHKDWEDALDEYVRDRNICWSEACDQVISNLPVSE